MAAMRALLASTDPVSRALLARLFPNRRAEVVVLGPEARHVALDLTREGFAARAGRATSDLLEAVEEERPDLLLLPAPAGAGLLHALNGDPVERILRASPVPAATAQTPPRAPLRHVLVPLDGGEVGWAALPVAGRLARGLDARVTLVHVNPDGPAHPRWTRERPSIAAAERELRSQRVPVSTATRRGRPAREILRACEEERGDLLILGTRARLTPARRLLGSVTETLLHEAPVPLVLVPARRETAIHPQPALLAGAQD